MKNTILTSVALGGVLLLSACGSSGTSDTIKNKKVVIIYTNAEAGACETSTFRDLLAQAGFQDFSTRETSLDTRCSTFGKVTGKNCEYIAWTGTPGNVNCVVGTNGARQQKQISDVAIYEASEILESAL